MRRIRHAPLHTLQTVIPCKNLGISERFQDFREFRRRFPRFHKGFGISQGFPNFVWDFKISSGISEISAKPYEISASGGPLDFDDGKTT